MIQEKKYCLYCGQPFTQKKVEGRVRLFCTLCNVPYYENPIPASCLVVIDDEEKILLVKRSVEPYIGSWCLPGGFIELEETSEEAAIYSSQYYSVIVVGYLVKSYTGMLHPGDDVSEVAYFDHDQLPDIPFNSHIQFIQTYYKENALL